MREIIKFPTFDVIHIIFNLFGRSEIILLFFTNNIIQLFVKRKITSNYKYANSNAKPFFNEKN